MGFKVTKFVPRHCRILIDHLINSYEEKKKSAFKMPVVSVDSGIVFDRFGNKYNNNHLTKILRNLEKSKKIEKRHWKMLMKHYLKIYNSQNGDWIKKFIGHKKKIHFGFTPWGGGIKPISKNQTTKRYCLDYIKRLRDIKKSILRKGYSVKKGGNISGELLIDTKGRKRAIIYRGQRRMAALASINAKKVEIELFNGFDKNGKPFNCTIDRKKADEWVNVKNGKFSKKEALDFFDYFFR